MPGVIVDIGTGDGGFVYALAKKYPDRLIIGIDPNHQGLVKTSLKSQKKPARGGVRNVLFVSASVENLPEELEGAVNQIFINFPWAGLLKAVVLAEDKSWRSIRRICKPGAVIDILFTYDERDELGLPVLNQSYIEEIKEKFERRGLEVKQFRILKTSDLKRYPSAWAKKLSYGKKRNYYFLRLAAL